MSTSQAAQTKRCACCSLVGQNGKSFSHRMIVTEKIGSGKDEKVIKAKKRAKRTFQMYNKYFDLSAYFNYFKAHKF